MKKRILILPFSAIVIVAMCFYAVNSYDPSAPRPIPPTGFRQSAPLFELYNHKSPQEMVRLQSFIGRHRILVVFFDGPSGLDNDATLSRLRRDFDKIRAADVRVFAISTALPQENRVIIASSGKYPFPLLSDPSRDVHRVWGLGDENADRPVSAVFFIDAAGLVNWKKDTPLPLDDPTAFIDRLIAGT